MDSTLVNKVALRRKRALRKYVGLPNPELQDIINHIDIISCGMCGRDFVSDNVSVQKRCNDCRPKQEDQPFQSASKAGRTGRVTKARICV